MTFLLATLAVTCWIALATVIAHQSVQVMRQGEFGTSRSVFFFPLSNLLEAGVHDESIFHFRRSVGTHGFPIGYMVFTAVMLPVRLPWIVCAGGFGLCFLAIPRFLSWFCSLSIKLDPEPPKIRVIEDNTDRAADELLDERKKLVEERGKLQTRLPEVEQRLHELEALLDEPQSGVFRGAPRSAKSQAT